MYEMKMRVGLDDVGINGAMTCEAMLRAMVNCASFHTQDRVYDILEMAENHRGWFVVSWQVRIHKEPNLCDRLTVRTFPYEFSGFIGKRHFGIYSEDGETLVSANSLWTWMDIEKARPVRIPEEYKELFGIDEPPTEEWPGRKLAVPEDMKTNYGFKVEPMFLDTNGHMNNSYYVAAAEKCLGEDAVPKAFYVEYRKQAKSGDEVTVQSSSDNGTVTLCDSEGDIYSVVKFEC